MPAVVVYTNIVGGAAAAPYGGRTLTIATVVFQALNWKPERGSRQVSRNDALGDEAHIMIRSIPASQSGLTLQVPLATTAAIPIGTTFTADAIVYVVTKASKGEPEGEFWQFDIDYREVP